MSDCIFCNIASKKTPAIYELENADCVAFRDINPKAPVHVLVIPRRHIISVQTAKGSDADILGRTLLAAKEIATKLGLSESGYRLIVNIGKDGGSEVDHLHIHVLGGKKLGAIG